MISFLLIVFWFVVKALLWVGLISYIIWVLYVFYRITFHPGKNGRLPWL